VIKADEVSIILGIMEEDIMIVWESMA